jgi:hypothetical protein
VPTSAACCWRIPNFTAYCTLCSTYTLAGGWGKLAREGGRRGEERLVRGKEAENGVGNTGEGKCTQAGEEWEKRGEKVGW